MESLLQCVILPIMQVQASRADPLPVCHGSCCWNSHPRCEAPPPSMAIHSLLIPVAPVVYRVPLLSKKSQGPGYVHSCQAILMPGASPRRSSTSLAP